MSFIKYKLLILSFIALIIFGISQKLMACDMIAFMARKGHTIAELMTDTPDTNVLKSDIYSYLIREYISPYDYFVFAGRKSTLSRNRDGYGIAYYKEGQPLIPPNSEQTFYLIGHYKYYKAFPESLPHQWRHPFHSAYENVRDEKNKAVIVLAHDRKASSQETIGSHPFRFQLDDEGNKLPDRTITFEHNGSCSDIKTLLIDYLLERNPNWFDEHPLNWTYLYDNPDSLEVEDIIDSEALFHFIMYHVLEADNDVIGGIINALNDRFRDFFDGRYPHDTINFILSDGEAIYIFRNSRIFSSSHNLEYKVFDDGFVGVKTLDENDDVYPDVVQHSLVYIPRDPDKYALPYQDDGVAVFSNIFDDFGTRYIQGDINANMTFDSGDYFIIGDTKIREGIELTVNAGTRIYIIGRHELKVNGKLNLYGELNLSHGALVTVDGENAEFFLNWGAKIVGSTPRRLKYYYSKQAPPNEVRIIKGDRIIVKNGGIISTSEQFEEHYLPVTISSCNDELWEGIKIEDTDKAFFFTNCDISGIKELSVKGGAYPDLPKLNFYKSKFHNAASIIIRNGVLNINGCEIYENSATPIIAIESEVVMDSADDDVNHIYANGGYGISVLYPSEQPSVIRNSLFYQNLQGARFNNHLVSIDGCAFVDNRLNGLVAEGLMCDVQLDENLIRNNGGAEYIGYSQSYDMSDGNNIIDDDIYQSGNIFLDKYLLMSLDDPLLPIDVSGNLIPTHNRERFFPSFNCFYFGHSQTEDSDAADLYFEGIAYMTEEDYFNASAIFETLIRNYPNSSEAVKAVRYLYFVENASDRNFEELRNFYNSVDVIGKRLLKDVIEEAIVLTFIAEGEYNLALDKLTVLSKRLHSDEQKIYMMRLKNYCRLRLAESNLAQMSERTDNEDLFYNFLAEGDRLDAGLFYNVRLADTAESFTKGEPLSNSINANFFSYPNPFNPSTNIAFTIPKASYIRLSVYNVEGQLVKNIFDGTLAMGRYDFVWNGTDEENMQVSSGIYFCRLQIAQKSHIRKMILLR